MDIQSLLSSSSEPPPTSSRSTPTPQVSSSPRKGGRSKQGIVPSPLANVTTPPDVPTISRASSALRPSQGPPGAGGALTAGGIRTPPTSIELGRQHQQQLHQQQQHHQHQHQHQHLQQQQQQQAPTSSANPLDNLASIASLQAPQQQQTRQATATPVIVRSTEQPYEPVGTPSALNPTIPSTIVSRPTPFSEPPRETIRTDYSNTCLSPDRQIRASELATEIKQNRYAYMPRIDFIELLHKGFVHHIYPPSSPNSRGDPHNYDVLKDLRTAREELDNLFAVGEDLWTQWIQDESLLARSIEERIAVIELCQRSVEEEYGSTKLWIIYGDWMLHLYNTANAPPSQQLADGNASSSSSVQQGQWSEEDRIIGQEAFKWESVIEVWRNAAEATKWHLNDSHLVWNRYLELLLSDLAKSPLSEENKAQLHALFKSRLQTPHLAWEQTFQLFSQFISTYYNEEYERTMQETLGAAGDTKRKANAREERERALENAIQSKDRVEEERILADYIDWEVNRAKRGGNYELAIALYQRAVLRFPMRAEIWEDYITFLIDNSIHHRISWSVLPALERATRHCPWSGSLWSHLLLSADTEGQSFQQISDIKHKATSTGLLDAVGINEVLKVHTTWCSYLRRHAFQADGTDENLDVAEVGIRSAIESIQELGDKEHKEVPNDPMFRLERIYIRYLSESGSWDSARETFKGLIRRHGHSSEFWLMYYSWELICWAKFTGSDGSAAASRRSGSPSLATAVLKQALRRTDLDDPRKIMDAYIVHCEHYEDAEELQLATVQIRKAEKAVAKRFLKQQMEAAAAAAAAPPQAAYPTWSDATAAPPHANLQHYQHHDQDGSEADDDRHGKRKRGGDADINGIANKKLRSDEMDTTADITEPPPALKRDREHSTVLVRNLAPQTKEVRIRQFFRDCGKLNALKILSDENSICALLEFESKEDALAAQTRDGKTLEGRSINVQLETKSTLWVTNFPPTADEAYIRSLFSPYGDIVEVRFPSLKFNTHRRFCYVQFQSASSAHAATELDGKPVGSGDKEKSLKLVAKISDPSRKQDRSGPVEEGREIHVSNLDWKATEGDLAELFGAYGKVETARIPTKANGGSKGFGFVVFERKESATAALDMDNQPFRNRLIHVHISAPTGPKRTSTTIVSRLDRSHSPAASLEAGGAGTNGTRGSTPTTFSSETAGDRRQRTLGLMNIPDTVNDTRIRALVEPYGEIIKIVLRPDHQGAIVEYRDVSSAGKASMSLEGKQLDGKNIHVGTVEEMLKQGAEKKVGKILVGKQRERAEGKAPSTATATKGLMQPSAPIRRPAQPGTGRRGGLGMKRGGPK